MNRATLSVGLLATLILTGCVFGTHNTPAPIQTSASAQTSTTTSARAPRVAAKPAQQQLASRSTSPPESRPKSEGGYLAGDGPGADIPADLDAIPDATPRAEPLRAAANRPYVALGKTYIPLGAPGNYREHGIASWYGKKFHGQPTSSGEPYDMYAMTAAHPTLPIPSYARVTNLSNNRSVIVRINDRGPFLHDRIIDLSYAAAHKLDIIGKGSEQVEVESLIPDVATDTPLKAEQDSDPPLPPMLLLTRPSMPVTGKAWLQLGAFRSEQSAESFLNRMRDEFGLDGGMLSLYSKDDLVRVHLGPYVSADEARVAAERLQLQLGFKPVVTPH
jgi:rare lipoprotein A